METIKLLNWLKKNSTKNILVETQCSSSAQTNVDLRTTVAVSDKYT